VEIWEADLPYQMLSRVPFFTVSGWNRENFLTNIDVS
jgi:hypothetical protein